MVSLDDVLGIKKREDLVEDADWNNVEPVTKQLATGLLDYSFNKYGYNPIITSGYRDPERNALAQGAPNSWHLQGKAVDLNLGGLSPEQIADIEAKAKENFGEVLYHDVGSGVHLHLANPISNDRNIIDRALFSTASAAPVQPAGISLDDVLNEKQPVAAVVQPQQKTVSLDDILSGTPTQPTQLQQPVSTLTQTTSTPSLFDEMGNPIINTSDSGLGQVINKYITEPTTNAVMTTLEYLDKPRGAIAGGVESLINNKDLVSGIQKGWKENTSWKEVLPKEERETTGGKVLGLALDIALDPLWVLTPAKAVSIVKRAGTFLGAEKVVAPVVSALEKAKNSDEVQKILQTEKELPGIGKMSIQRMFSERGPLDELFDKMKIDKAKLNEQVAEAGKVLEPISPKGRELVTQAIEAKPSNINLPPEKMYEALSGRQISDTVSDKMRDDVLLKARLELPAQEADLVEKAVDTLSKFGMGRSEELLKRGIISQETYDKYYGRYIRREYLKYENPEEFIKQLRESGNIKEADKLQQTIDTIADKVQKRSNVKMNWNDIKQRQALTEAEQEMLGRVMDASHPFAKGGQVSSDLIAKYDFLESVAKQFGSAEHQTGWRLLEGKGFGPLENMWVPKEVFNEVNNIVKSFSSTDSAWRQAVSWWKMGKTILNPAAHARNFMSNAILLDMAGVPTAKVPLYLTRAGKEMVEKGKYYDEARKNTTILLNTFKEAEALQLDKPGVLKSVVDKAGDLYQSNEVLGKLAAYIYAREKGMDVAQAGKFAMDALFDYSKVPPVIDYLRKSGLVPFASFPYFATKATAKTLYNDPMTILKYYKPIVAGRGEQEKAQEKLYPKWMQPQNYLPLGKGTRLKDNQKQEVDQYLDVSFIYPFDSDVSISPAFSLAAALATNTNWLTGGDIARKGMLPTDKAGEYFKYAAQQLLPSFAPYGYSADKLMMAFKGEMDKQGRQYTPQEAIAHTILGLKNVPIDTGEMAQKAFKGMKYDMLGVRSTMRDIMKDKRLSPQQKQEQIKEYAEHIKQLQQQMQVLSKAYETVKKKPIE